MHLPILLVLLLIPFVRAEVIAYPLALLYKPTSIFRLTADSVPIPTVFNSQYYYAHFSVSGATQITIRTSQAIDYVRISPKKLSIKPRISGNTISFTLPHDAYLIVKINKYEELVLLADAPEQRVPPTKGAGIYNVVEHGADHSGVGLSTQAFQSAINSASRAWPVVSANTTGYTWDQALVVVPPGVYLLGNVQLKSNTALYLSPGSVLRFTGNKEDYTAHWHKQSQARDVTWWISTSFDSRNIRVFGRGVVDGNGWASTVQKKRSADQIGNNLLVPIATTGFRCEGVVFRNSASWAITPIGVSDAVFRNIKVLNRMDMGENDGIDVMHSTDVTIDRSIGIALDDPFSTKTWGPGKGITENWPNGVAMRQSRNIVFSDAISWTRCFGYKVGQGVFTRQSHITFRDSVVYDAAVGLGVNHRYGNGTVKGVTFENMEVERTSRKLEERSSWAAVFTQEGDTYRGGMVEGVTFKNIKVWSKGLTQATFSGYQNDTEVTDLVFDDVFMPGVDKPATSLEGMDIKEPKWVVGITIQGKKMGRRFLR